MTNTHYPPPPMSAREQLDPNSLRENMAQTALSFFLLLTSSTAIVVFFLYLRLGHAVQEQVLTLTAAVVFFSLWLFSRATKHTALFSSLALITTMGFIVWALSTNAVEGLGFFWVYFIPSYAFLLKGKRIGTRYVIFYLSLIALVYIGTLLHLTPTQLSPTVMVHSASSLIFTSILAWMVSSLQHQYRLELVHAYKTHQQFRMAVDSSSNHIVITDTNGIILYANPAAEQTTGFEVSEMAGQTPRLWGGLMPPETYRELWRTIKYDKKPFFGEITNINKAGQLYTALARISPIVDEGTLVGFIGTEENISHRLELETQLKSKVAELEKTNRLMINRELKMRELKAELAQLKGSQPEKDRRED